MIQLPRILLFFKLIVGISYYAGLPEMLCGEHVQRSAGKKGRRVALQEEC